MPETQITIAIPVYNFNTVYLQRAIDSVLSQSQENWELLIVDGRDDSSGSLEQFLTRFKHPRISYLRNNTDHSMAGNWNYAIESTQTELVTLLHEDDYLEPEYIDLMLQTANQYPRDDAYFCSVTIVDSQGRQSNTMADRVKRLITPPGDMFVIDGDSGLAALLKGCFIYCPTVCYRKSKMKLPVFNARWQMVVDLDLYIRMITKGGRLRGINMALYNYRRHDQNQTLKLNQSLVRFEEEVALYNEVAEKALKLEWPMSHKKAVSKSMIKLHLYYLFITSILKFNLPHAKKLRRFLNQINN